jgi:DNA-binding transcriptional ArsR family regulator
LPCEVVLLELPWLDECSCFGFFGFFVFVAEVDVWAAVVVVVVDADVVVSAHAPSVSPCATCAATAGRAMLIVCELPLPVTWQTSTFSWPTPSSPDVVAPAAMVLVVWRLVEVETEIEVDCWSLSSCSKSWSSFASEDLPAKSFSPFVEDDSVVLVLTAETVVDGCEVIWARPTPAAAAKARPTTTPTTERRLNRRNRLCTFESLSFAGALALQPSVAPTRKNLRSASREIEASRGYDRAMYADADLASVGALLAEPARAKVLMALGDGRSLPASMLASEAGVAASTASHHLARLVDGGLLTVVTRGRHRYFTLAGPHIAELLEAVARVAPAQPVRSLREGTRAHTLRYARRCYDHLAGRLGIAVADALHLIARDGTFEISDVAAAKLVRVGIDVNAGETARACLDWTEQQHHLAGELGRTLLRRLLELDWLQRDPHTRAVRLTDDGRAGLPAQLGVIIP